MAIFIIGQKSDQERLWIVDTENKTVEPFVADESADNEGSASLSAIPTLRGNGYTVIRDIDVAVVVNESEGPVSRQFS
ncbi:hypothetical protein [Aureimonas sp. AU12]|uniref:hypothetical protein n=1 Tax=Aureimonas sp. AU12 TaxID=1638161 RepID=UPI0007862B82|nr:hypothetical protein [Aureimonas sp. AU12]